MKPRNILACAFAALAVVGGTAGTAQAEDEAKFDNGNKLLSCNIVEVIDQPALQADEHGGDCSKNVEKSENELVDVVDKAEKVISPRHHEYR